MWGWLVKKTRGRKSRDTVPLIKKGHSFGKVCEIITLKYTVAYRPTISPPTHFNILKSPLEKL
jgi:hypothetical protein